MKNVFFKWTPHLVPFPPLNITKLENLAPASSWNITQGKHVHTASEF